jgi:hypothetical protein
MEDQSTVVSGIGEDTPLTDTNIKPPEVIPPSELNNPRSESILSTLDNVWPTNTLTDAMLRQLQAFVSEVLGFADRALQEFDQMVQEFWQEREDQQMELWELHADSVDPWSIIGILDTSITSRLWQITSNMEAMVSTCWVISAASNRMFTLLNSKIEDSVWS